MSEEKPPYQWRLGEILIQNGWVTWEQLEEALKIQERLKSQVTSSTSSPSTLLPMHKRPKGLNLGEILIKHNYINWDELSDALQTQGRMGGVLGEICLQKGYVKENQLYHALALQFGLLYVDFKKIKIQPEVLKMIPREFVINHRVVPLVDKRNELLVAMANFLNVAHEEELQKLLPNHKVYIVVASPTDINHAIAKYYEPEES